MRYLSIMFLTISTLQLVHNQLIIYSINVYVCVYSCHLLTSVRLTLTTDVMAKRLGENQEGGVISRGHPGLARPRVGRRARIHNQPDLLDDRSSPTAVNIDARPDPQVGHACHWTGRDPFHH